jgi:hypothetical protein
MSDESESFDFFVKYSIWYRVEPFLGNGPKQRVSRGNSPHSTLEILLETVFSTSVPRGYKENNWSRIRQLEGGAIEREISPEGTTVRSRYHTRASEGTAGWKRQLML